MRVRVEVCVTGLAEAKAAHAAGADHIELCTWLACGGVTPSYGLVNTVREVVPLPMRVLVRPTPAGFVYSDDERQVILRDSMLLGMSGSGLVVGGLDANGLPHEVLVKGVKLSAPDQEITFHRAIDHAGDMAAAFSFLCAWGVHRVLTSGGRTRALDGAPVIKAFVEQAAPGMVVAAAGGIDASNVVELVERTGVSEVHFAAQRALPREPDGKAAMSSSNVGAWFDTVPDVAKIEGVLNALVKAGLR